MNLDKEQETPNGLITGILGKVLKTGVSWLHI